MGKSVSEIESMTLTNVFKKFNENTILDKTQLSATGVNYIIERNLRRFCPICLKEKGYYKLLWQIKEISICLEHNIPLQTICHKCGNEQLYISESLVDLSCFKCGNTLFNYPDIINDNDLLNKNYRYYKEWEFLKDGSKALSTYQHSKDRDLALKILYLTQPSKEIFNLNSTRIISVSTSSKYKNFVLKKESSKLVSIQMFFAVIRELKIDIEIFHKIEVPQKFIGLINNEREQRTVEICLCPWCEYYKINYKNNLRRLVNKFITMEGTKYSKPSICLGCSMKHGYNEITGDWEVDRNVEILLKVKELMFIRKNKTEIIEEDKISKRLLDKLLGYIAYHKLVSYDVLKRFVSNKKETEEKDILNCFKEIAVATQSGLFDGLNKASYKMFGWSQPQFYYNFWNKNIQEYLNFEFYPNCSRENHTKKNNKINNIEDPKLLTKKVIERFLKLDIDISIDAVAKELGFGVTKCISLKLHPFIKEGKEEQKK